FYLFFMINGFYYEVLLLFVYTTCVSYFYGGEYIIISTQSLLGSYTRRVNEGIYSAVINPVTNQLDEVSLLAEVGSPTYLDTNEDKSIIYSVINENDKGGIV